MTYESTWLTDQKMRGLLKFSLCKMFEKKKGRTNWYWPNCLLVLANLTNHTYKLYPYCLNSEIAYPYEQNRLPELAKSPTSIGQIVYRY